MASFRCSAIRQGRLLWQSLVSDRFTIACGNGPTQRPGRPSFRFQTAQPTIRRPANGGSVRMTSTCTKGRGCPTADSALSGLRNPYPGKLGVVEPGALADLLIVDGNPLDNINLVADPANKFLIIMKDGVIYKDAIPR